MIRAIQTRYAGHRFRSRLEARWAIFFDVVGVRWLYETEGYLLNGGMGAYLPDFYLPDLHTWIEVKPAVEQPAVEKLERLALDAPTSVEGSRARGAILTSIPQFFNDVGPPPPDAWVTVVGAVWADTERHGGFDATWSYMWCECPECGSIDLQFDGRAERNYCGCGTDYDRWYNYNTPRLLRAYAAAREARFEHGERGRLGA